ncbi:LysR family transcriptional regulator ArgP [Thioclava litoralis]|uniref:LysR family transcriptional regulator ArgP n=1 Tax=Thioclava litoralis TaxID=3076557 RepID=A0ABZ1DYR4_9RHOB|nr:LysR family transcriptional regulator ArgP [Thioclava sp. FTW29]
MLDYPALQALAAVIESGSFEAAAHALRVTPSAVSQRIKTLEDRMGAVLVVRGQPCSGTAQGMRLAQHLAQVQLLEHSLTEQGEARLRVAINADSLATWALPALAGLEALFDLVIEDETQSEGWLKRGEVMGAVTTNAHAVAGCDIVALGRMRYIPCATPDFIARHFPHGVTAQALTEAPALVFSAKDGLQAAWARQHYGVTRPLKRHQIGATHDFLRAGLLGMGWALHPHMLARDHLASGGLVALDETQAEVPLYWQFLRNLKEPLAPLSRALQQAAKAQMVSLASGAHPR